MRVEAAVAIVGELLQYSTIRVLELFIDTVSKDDSRVLRKGCEQRVYETPFPFGHICLPRCWHLLEFRTKPWYSDAISDLTQTKVEVVAHGEWLVWGRVDLWVLCTGWKRVIGSSRETIFGLVLSLFPLHPDC